MGMMINRRRVCGGKKLHYDAEIEYLGFAQDCRVYTTGIMPSTNYKYYWKCLLTGRRNWNYLFTNGSAIGDWFIFGGTETDSSTNLHIGSNYNTRGKVLNVNTLYDGSLMRNGSKIEERLNNALMVSLNYQDFQSSKTLLIQGNTPLWRVYNFSIYNEDNVLIIDFIPVRVGNVGYMYDKVSKQLFGNAGTGSFILGPDI